MAKGKLTDQMVYIINEDLEHVLKTDKIKRKNIITAFLDYLEEEELFGKNKNEVVLDDVLAGLLGKKVGSKVTRSSLLKLTGKDGVEDGLVEY